MSQDKLFDTDTYVCQSKHHNLIAFTIELTLLSRVLRGAMTNSATSVQVKLSQHTVTNAEGHQETKPILAFTGRGNSMSITQEMPVSRPFTALEIDQLVECKDVSILCPFYVDLAPATQVLQGLVDKIRSLGDTALLAMARNGDVHLQVTSPNISLGSQIRGLHVFPEAAATAQPTDRQLPADQQLQAALTSREAVSVRLLLKHLSKVLAIQGLTNPSQILCGIAERGAYVHLLMVYRHTSNESEYDDNMALTFKLPVRMDD
ncbi:MAG: hypothetical protein WDW36_008695 [Sanguina aurantia]